MIERLKKLSTPGWKIEPIYINKVLIGNWYEERLQRHKRKRKHKRKHHRPCFIMKTVQRKRKFAKVHTTGNSTHKLDYIKPESEPDTTTRRKLAQKSWEGVGQNCLLNHHGNAYMTSSAVTNYLLDYQNPSVEAPLRTWDGHKFSWVPEKIDVPIQDDRLKSLLKFKQLPPLINLAHRETASGSKGNQCPAVHVPGSRDSQVVLKYKHRKTDVTPFFPVILRSRNPSKFSPKK